MGNLAVYALLCPDFLEVVFITTPRTIPRTPTRANPRRNPPNPPTRSLCVEPFRIEDEPIRDIFFVLYKPQMTSMEIALIHGPIRMVRYRCGVCLNSPPEIAQQGIFVVDRLNAVKRSGTSQKYGP